MSAADVQSQNIEASQNNLDLHLETQNMTQPSMETTQASNLMKTRDLEQDLETKVNGEIGKRLVDYDQISDDETGKPTADKSFSSVQKDSFSIPEATSETAVLAKDTTPSEEALTDAKETEKGSSPVKKSALRRRKASSSPERDLPSEPKRIAVSNKKMGKGTAGSDTTAALVEETTTTTTDDEKPTDSPRRTRERRKQESESSDTSTKRTLRSADHPSAAVQKKVESEKHSTKKSNNKTTSSSDTSASKQVSSAKKSATDVKRTKASGDNVASIKSKPSRTPSAVSPSRASPSRAAVAPGRPPGKKSGGGKKPSGRVYDSDDFQDEEAATGEKSPAPLKHVHVARGAFGDMKFTKAAADESPKYVSLTKSAEKRRQKSVKLSGSSATPVSSGKADTQTSDSVKKGKTFTTEQLKRKSLKSSLSPGEMADVSSYNSKSSAPSTGGPRDSVGGVVGNRTVSPKRPAPESPDSKKKQPTPSAGGSGKKSTQGSSVLFGDVSQKICVDFDDVHFLTDGSISKSPTATITTPTVKKGRPASSTSKRKTPSSSKSVSTEERHRERKREETYSRSPTPGDLTPRQSKKRRPVDKLTPKPKKPQLEKLSPEQQLERDVASQRSHHLQPGCRALCRWADRCFYAAYVIEDIGFGRYTVRFVEDRQYSNIPYPEIIPIVNLKPGNTLMMKPKESRNEYILTPIKIISLPSITSSEEWFQGMFEVENTQTQEVSKASWERLFIDADQTKDYISRQDMVNKAAQEVVEDNISDSRVRRNRGKRSQAFEEEPEDQEEEAAEVVPVSASKRSVSKTHRPKSAGGHTPRQKLVGAGHAPKATKKMKVAELEYSDMQGVINEDTDEERLSIFDDMVFVLTSANRARPRDGSDSLEEERPLIPFNKKQVRQMIDELGGKVIDDFMILSDTQSCFLVADQYYRTHKYLSALARAVPCVSHMWIHDCCQAGQLLQHNNYMLPAGQSLETNQIIEWHNKCPQLLANKKIFVYTENRPTNPGALDFVQIWAPLVKCMGSQLLESLPQAEDEDSHVDILLTDISCPNSVLAQATSLGANAVSSEWLIQAIITGRMPEPNGHLKYRYDYVEKPDTQQ